MTALPTSLRERKKAKTRAAIREHAMRLFEEQGYAATTVDQIADAAEVSPSTFFRYFPAKEDVVLADDLDEVMVRVFLAQPAELAPLDAMMQAVRDIFTGMDPQVWAFERRRQDLIFGVPELRARAIQQMTETVDLFAGAIAQRQGLPADHFPARVMAGAAVGAILAIMPSGVGAQGVTPGDHSRMEQALTLLRDGLPLG
ncbi:TetR family transcriptional regulator [Actinoplanes utahensis]|uniref:TetR family transcriptional regulator n=1 Tax=Actinoplanes utahensis TaxID=1869 RepID=A0A0A6WX52_ACTUT|nr:TetR family transcriptional regulator [Actinoplanes utahensis]KHD72272.1 TetR family transcriptional regulator [Actinoplanes utahensis]GIF35555.1 TetR family transcriptional regulator [Actinoplanes utahensis]